MSPETIALTLFVVAIFSIVISQLALEVSIIPKWDTFNAKKKVTCNLKKVKQGLPVLVAAAVFCRHSMVYKDNK